MKRIIMALPEGVEPQRVDQFLASQEGIASRGMAQRLIREGRVRVGDRVVHKVSLKVEPGTVLSCEIPPPRPFKLVPSDVPLKILYEDEEILVVNKPPHMVVHPAPGHETDTVVNALLSHTGHLASLGGDRRPGIVHRLDKGTSGVLVVAKTDGAYLSLTRQFRNREVKKVYHALVYGRMEMEEGMIDHAIVRSARDRKRMTVSRVHGGGREAVTTWRVQRSFPGLSFLELSPRTGRTHQLRVHLNSLGHPIVGDPVYGRRRFPTTGVLAPLAKDVKKMGRQALHASRITFFHPVSQAEMTIRAPLPEDLKGLLQKLDKLFAWKEDLCSL